MLDLDRLKHSARAAVSYLVRHTDADGRYDYIYDLDRRAPRRGYNLIRHAGATMELAYFIASEIDDGSVRATVEANWRFIEGFLVPLERSGREAFCVAEGDVAKLGGSALALVAMANMLSRPSPIFDDTGTLRRLANYLCLQQTTTGSFVCKEVVSLNLPLVFESAYYEGEAALALCCAYRVLGAVEYLERAGNAATFLMASRHLRNGTGRFADHWLAKTLSELHLLTADQHWHEMLRKLTSAIAASNQDNWPDGISTTALSTRLEALIAALEVEIRLGYKEQASWLVNLVGAGLDVCLRRQFIDKPEVDAAAIGGFAQASGGAIIRIDYVQHALGAIRRIIALDNHLRILVV